MPTDKKIQILLAGEGGQGIQTIAKSLAETAAKDGYEVSYIPVFGVEQRGTPSISMITISKSQIRYPRFETADMAVVLRTRAIPRVVQYISPSTEIIFDSSTVDYKQFPKRAIRLHAIEATKLATENYHPKSFNLMILGILTKKLNLDKEQAWQSARDNLGSKLEDPKVRQQNLGAFEYGYDAVMQTKNFPHPVYETKKNKNTYKNAERIGEIYPSLCKGCGICIEKCPVKALSFGEDLGHFSLPVPKIDITKCIACGNCRRFCPDGAIGVDKLTN